MELRESQVMRRMRQNWRTSNLYCEMALQSIDSRLRFAGEGGNFVSFPQLDIWHAFRNALGVSGV